MAFNYALCSFSLFSQLQQIRSIPVRFSAGASCHLFYEIPEDLQNLIRYYLSLHFFLGYIQ